MIWQNLGNFFGSFFRNKNSCAVFFLIGKSSLIAPVVCGHAAAGRYFHQGARVNGRLNCSRFQCATNKKWLNMTPSAAGGC